MSWRSQRWRRGLSWTLPVVFAAAIALFMVAFHQGEMTAQIARERLLALSPWWFVLITPITLGGVRFLTLRFFPAAAGSGIPQVMAVTEQSISPQRAGEKLLLSPVGALFKAVAVSLSMAGGGTVGREGPAVQVGASLLSFGSRLSGKVVIPHRVIAIAGAATGLAAAFSTPLAGVMYAFEEFLWRRRYRAIAIVPVCVAATAITGWLVTRDRQFFDVVVDVVNMPPWWSILTLAVFCGVGAGAMGWLMMFGLPRILPTPRSPAHGAWIAGLIGLVLALLGVWSNGLSMGSGNETSAVLLDSAASLDTTVMSVGLTKALATTLTFATGVPAGILTPSLAIGGGFGFDFAALTGLNEMRQALVLFGMTAFLAGVIRTPVTVALMVAEMSGAYAFGIELFVCALIGGWSAKSLCRESVYDVAVHRILKR